MHRTQILLEDEQYERLKLRSKTTGRAIGDLVRAAVDQAYGAPTTEDRREALRTTAGALGPDAFDGLDGEEWVSRNRRGTWRKFEGGSDT